jgi:hypothetical protein
LRQKLDSEKTAGTIHRLKAQAGIAQLVEHNLAKVGVASSNLVSRSIFYFVVVWCKMRKMAQEYKTSILRSGFFSFRPVTFSLCTFGLSKRENKIPAQG